jgi:hypothetical protein
MVSKIFIFIFAIPFFISIIVAQPPARAAAALDYMESQSVSEVPSEEGGRVENFAPVVFPANLVIVGRDPSRIGPLNRFSRLHMAGVMCFVCTVIFAIIVGLLVLWHKL